MSNINRDKIIAAYERSQEFWPFFDHYQSFSLPLAYQDSVSPVPNYPFCALGVLSAEGERGNKKGIAFVVGDNYLLTCASNCYQHGYGRYPSITFTIDSNRKSGSDTYKISEVFIPEDYINSNESEKKYNNYALLYIEGEPNMGDKYGIISLTFGNKCKICNNQTILLCTEKLSSNASGAPQLRFPSKTQFKKAIGLIIQGTNIQKPTVLHFDQTIFNQLNQWAKGQINIFNLDSRKFHPITTQELDESGIKEKEARPLQCFIMEMVDFKDPDYFFEHVPYSSIARLYLTQTRIGDSLAFLKLEKFRGLKQLQLTANQISPLGCKMISSLPINDLRRLVLNKNRICDEGCKYFSNANWPYLTKFELFECRISSKGMLFLSQQKWPNITKLHLGGNYIDSETSSFLEKANLPRIQIFCFGCKNKTNENLVFLKSPSWKSLRQLLINNSNMGSKGCKILKQTNIPFTKLQFYHNKFSCIGVKWLCKANLTKLQYLQLRDNQIRNYGYLLLSLAHMPHLNWIGMSIQNFSDHSLNDERMKVRGFQWLLKSDWVKSVGYQQSSLSQLADYLKRYQLVWWNLED